MTEQTNISDDKSGKFFYKCKICCTDSTEFERMMDLKKHLKKHKKLELVSALKTWGVRYT